MLVIDFLDSLAEAGHLTALCQAGLVSVKAHAQREIYGVYQALAQLPPYQAKPQKLAQETADVVGVHLATVYRAVEAMQRPLELPQGACLTFAKVGE